MHGCSVVRRRSWRIAVPAGAEGGGWVRVPCSNAGLALHPLPPAVLIPGVSLGIRLLLMRMAMKGAVFLCTMLLLDGSVRVCPKWLVRVDNDDAATDAAVYRCGVTIRGGGIDA